jgi:hypothetical protein
MQVFIQLPVDVAALVYVEYTRSARLALNENCLRREVMWVNQRFPKRPRSDATHAARTQILVRQRLNDDG